MYGKNRVKTRQAHRQMKILLVYLQPKDIPEVLEPLEDIFCDKLYLKYIPYPDVYFQAYDFIKLHSEYTHIFWLQNDIVLTPLAFGLCVAKFKVNNLKLLGLSMNVGLSGNEKFYDAYTIEPFALHYNHTSIEWAKKGQYKGIKNVFHNGGPFLIERKLYLKFPLHGEVGTGFNADMHFGFELWRENILYPIDTEANLKHLRYVGKMQVNLKTPHTEFIRI